MKQCFVGWFTTTFDNASTFVNQKNLFSGQLTLVHTAGTHGEQQRFWLDDSTKVSASARQPSASVQRFRSRGKVCRDFTECRAWSVGRSLHHRSSTRFYWAAFHLKRAIILQLAASGIIGALRKGSPDESGFRTVRRQSRSVLPFTIYHLP